MEEGPFAQLKADLTRAWAYGSGGTLRKLGEVVRSPGVHTVIVLRFGQWTATLPWLLRLPLGFIYAVLNEIIKIVWGIAIPRRARIGGGLYIGHFGGIFLNGQTVIGRNCVISQGVTIGDNGGSPVIGDDVYIGPGAKVFGPIRVGHNVKIGANAVIHADLPDNAVAAAPAFVIVSMRGNRRAVAPASGGSDAPNT
jgi:serine O-acetyltransferase